MSNVLPNCLAMVNRVLFECGVPEVAVLGNRESRVALEALNDSTADIWIRQRWTFQRANAFLTMVANQADYALPADFDRIAHGFRTNQASGFTPITEKTPEEYYVQATGFLSSSGQPLYFTVRNTTVSFLPAPAASFIALSPQLEWWYFKCQPTRRTTADGANSWDLPLDMHDAMIMFGKAKLKTYLEASPADINSDLQEYERKLGFLRNKYRLNRVAPTFKTGAQNPIEW